MKAIFRQIVFLLLLAVLPASACALWQWRSGKWDAFRDSKVPLSDISRWKSPILWVDARSAQDYAADHIPGAVRLTEDNWSELLPDLLKVWEPTSILVVYCNSQKCHASEEVAKRLREEVGLKRVYVLAGGWDAWKGAQK